jgi:hypothetical protein
LFNAMLLALAIMFVFWRWLAAVWDQQLLDGAAWTTAGRLIPYAKRAAYILAALAMLLAFQMALWPWMVPASADDNTAGRLASGLIALLLPAVVVGRSAIGSPSSSRAGLALLFVVAAGVFVFIRLPAGAFRGGLIGGPGQPGGSPGPCAGRVGGPGDAGHPRSLVRLCRDARDTPSLLHFERRAAGRFAGRLVPHVSLT